MRAALLSLSISLPFVAFAHGRAQTLDQPYAGRDTLTVTVPDFPAGYNVELQAFENCTAGAQPLSGSHRVDPTTKAGTSVPLKLNKGAVLKDGQTVCVVATYSFPSGASAPLEPKLPTASELKTTKKLGSLSEYCSRTFNDCNWGYTVTAGAEQSGTSSQASQTNPFVDLFVRGPRAAPVFAWSEVRLLGAPSASSTQGIVAAASNPTGTLTAASLSSVGDAVDYVVGVQFDFLRPKDFGDHARDHSFGFIAAFGATSPFSSQSASIAYAVPAYGTEACSQLLSRFGSGSTYNPSLPGSAAINTTSAVTTGGSTTTSNSTSPVFCSVNPVSTSSTSSLAGTTVVTTTSGTQITTVAFAPTDRTSFLLKYLAGIRFTNRARPNGTGNCHGKHQDSWSDNCARTMIDFTLGQDEAITGGSLHRLVYKTNAVFRIPNTDIFLFGSAAIRGERDVTQTPIVLTQVPIYTGGGSAPTGSVTVPSPSVYLLPLRQQDRDFYRIGVALDLTKILPKLFAKSTSANGS